MRGSERQEMVIGGSKGWYVELEWKSRIKRIRRGSEESVLSEDQGGKQQGSEEGGR